MKFHIFFVATLFCIFNSKHSLSLSVPNVEIQDTLLKEYDGKFSIFKVWQNIKYGLSAASESLVNANKETVENVKTLISELQLKTNEVSGKLKDHLKELREYIKLQFDEIATESKEKAELLRKCYQPHEQEIEDIVNDSLDYTQICIFTSNRDTMSELERTVSSSAVNEAMFIENVKSKFDSCASDEENLDQCLTNVNDYIQYQITSKDINVVAKENDAKIIIANILDKLLICSTEGFTKASKKLSDKVNDFEKCIKNGT